MPNVRVAKGKTKKKKTQSFLRKNKNNLSLPVSKSERSDDIRDYSLLVHGEKKIGKTTLFSMEEDNLFLEFDPVQQALEVYQVQCSKWEHFLEYLKLLEKESTKSKPQFRTVTVDGVDLMYQSCFVYTCHSLGIEHPQDLNDFGASWTKIKRAFTDTIHRLLNLNGIACRFICHSTWKEIKERGSGNKIEKLVPTLTRQAEEVLVSLVDVWAAYIYDVDMRVLVIKGDETIGAGHRIDHKFLTKSGKRIEDIPMGSSPEEAYQNLVSAFNGKQKFVSVEEEKERSKPKKSKSSKSKLKLKKK